jgi:uncharacterized protein (TIRG00374 family)
VKLAINVFLSLAMLALFTWLVWPSPAQRIEIEKELAAIELVAFLPTLLGFLGLLAVTHLCRAWRWRYLLRPIGADLPAGRLLAISSVGFMAILALPARLGEFVRPALVRKKGQVSAAAALGTVAVERIVDGLLVSLFVFGALFALRGPGAPSWMMPTAWSALGIFSAAMIFLAFALRWPTATVAAVVRATFLRRISPRVADLVSDKLRSMIDGFTVLKDGKNAAVFLLWTVGYWVANGLSLWVLARGFGLGLTVVAAFAVMGLVAVGISLPNSPGLFGQFHHFTKLGLTLYLPAEIVASKGLAFAIALHGLQVIWYVGVGALAIATPYVSIAEVVAAGRSSDDPGHAS